MSNNPAPSPATQCPHCGAWIFTRLYYRQHVQECANRTLGMKDLSDGALEAFPPIAPARWWHVQGEVMQGDTVLNGTRIVSGADEAEAINKITQAAQSARGGAWTWVTSPIVVRHAARDDESCPICQKLNAFTHCHEGDCPNMTDRGTRYCAEHLASNHKWWARHANEERMSHDEYQDGIDALYQQAPVTPNFVKDSPLMGIIEQSDTE